MLFDKVLGHNSEKDRLIDELTTELQEKSFRLALLMELSKALNSTVDLNEILKLTLSSLEAISRAEAVSVALVNRKENLGLVAGRGFDNLMTEKQVFALNYTESPIWNVYLSGETFFGHTDTVSSLKVTAAFPLISQQRVLGVLNIHKAPSLNDESIQFLDILSSQTALAIQNAGNYLKIKAEAKSFEEKANTDAMTKLYNRLFMMERFPQELARANRSGSPLTLLVFDVDHFKRFNDTHGHLFGDIVLKDVAALVRENLREYDLPIRYGGEEFLVILPDTGISMGLGVAERIRKTIEEHDFVDPEKGITAKVTISIGVSEWDRKGDVRELIDQADAALYRAKETGRNRVVRYGKGMVKK